MTPLVVVANRRAGSADRLDHATAVLQAAVETVVVEVATPEDLEGALAGTQGGTIVAAGGDGTLNMVVQHLWTYDLLDRFDVGLLPLGTGNDLARTMGIPLDPAAAAGIVVAGHSRRLDLLVDDGGTVAVNAVHAGVGGLVATQAARLKPLLGRVAYVAGAAWAGARSPGWAVRVEVDGALLAEGKLLFVGIGNGATIGGGAVLWPRARPDDGLAGVTVALAGGVAARLEMGRALRSGDLRRADGIVLGRGRTIRIEGEPMPYNVDGEALPAAATRSWQLEKRAWRLRVPAARTARQDRPHGGPRA